MWWDLRLLLWLLRFVIHIASTEQNEAKSSANPSGLVLDCGHTSYTTEGSKLSSSTDTHTQLSRQVFLVVFLDLFPQQLHQKETNPPRTHTVQARPRTPGPCAMSQHHLVVQLSVKALD